MAFETIEKKREWAREYMFGDMLVYTIERSAEKLAKGNLSAEERANAEEWLEVAKHEVECRLSALDKIQRAIRGI